MSEREEGNTFYVDTRPTWEGAIRIHLRCIQMNPDNSTAAEDEIIRAAQLLDMLVAEYKEYQECQKNCPLKTSQKQN